MKSIHLLLACSVIAFTSCSTYKNAQTPDDIYYSTGGAKADGGSDYYTAAPSDQYVQMRVQDPARWSYFDNYYDDAFYPGTYSPYGMGAYGYGYGSPWLTFGYWSPYTYWNSYFAWNSFYNPYYGSVVVANPKIPINNLYSHLRPFSPGSYNNSKYTGRGVAGTGFSPYSQPVRYAGTSSNASSSRHLYNGSSNVTRSYEPYRSTSQPTRSYSPSSFSGGTSSGNSGGGGMRTGGGGMGRAGR